jgi:MSHA biogenesis protein MshJ
MNSFFSTALKEFMALSARERLLAVLAVAGLLVATAEFAWVRPQEMQARALRDRLKAQEVEVEVMSKAVQALTAPAPPKATTEQLQERDRLRAAVEAADEVVRGAASEVKLGEVVRKLAVSAPDVKVVSLRTLPTERFFIPPPVPPAAAKTAPSSPSAAPAALPPLYKHGVEVTLSGSYRSLMPYLRSLEQVTAGMYWGTAKLDVQEYPETLLRLTLYTFSIRPEVTFE